MPSYAWPCYDLPFLPFLPVLPVLPALPAVPLPAVPLPAAFGIFLTFLTLGVRSPCSKTSRAKTSRTVPCHALPRQFRNINNTD